MNILEEAQKAVADREAKYGSPINHFEEVAALWNAYGFRVYEKGTDTDVVRYMTASDFANAMILLKTAREKFHSSDDNKIDIAGYSLCKDIIEKEANSKQSGIENATKNS